MNPAPQPKQNTIAEILELWGKCAHLAKENRDSREWEARKHEAKQQIEAMLNDARYEVLNDLLEWEKLWAGQHPDKPFNYHGAIKAVLVMKTPQAPFTTLKASSTKEYDLQYCDTCVQMTNHLDDICQKHTTPPITNRKD